MRCAMSVFLAFFPGFAITGCKSNKKEDLKQFYDKLEDEMDALADALATIQDRTSAKAAITRIREIGLKLKDLKDQRDRLKTRTPQSVTDEVLKEIEPRMISCALKMKKEMNRVSTIPGGREAIEEVKKAAPGINW
jgi:hypothetical protein